MSKINHRFIDTADLEAALAFADRALANLKGRPVAAVLAPHALVDFIFNANAERSFVIDDTYSLSYSITTPPGYRAPVLVCFHLGRLYNNGGDLANVVAFLKQEATAFGAAGIAIGSMYSTNPDALSVKLQALGLTKEDALHFTLT